jgi:hypothetical protein
MTQGPGTAPKPPRTISNPGTLKAVSAARAAPLPDANDAVLTERLAKGATNTALNTWGSLRDLWADFRSQDRFFKYKAAVVALWLALSGTGVWVACPAGSTPGNVIGARLVRTQVLDSPVLMIVNESGKPWKDVVVVVNQSFRAAVARVGDDPPENNLTLDPKKLLGEGGKQAPSDLRIRDLEVRTSSGRAVLLKDGVSP